MLVIFDVDGTLINSDSLLLSAKLSNNLLKRLLAFLSIFPWFFLYKLRLISTIKFKEKFLIVFKICEKFNHEEKKGNSKWFLPHIKNKINTAALERLKMHKSKGDKVVLCSASFDMLLQDFADYLKVKIDILIIVKTIMFLGSGLIFSIILGGYFQNEVLSMVAFLIIYITLAFKFNYHSLKPFLSKLYF